MIDNIEYLVSKSQSIELTHLIMMIKKEEVLICKAEKIKFNFIPNMVQPEDI